MSLTMEDRAALHDLYARYAYAFDGADPEAWSALFTADGVFAPPGIDPVVGTEELQSFVELRAKGLPGMRHLMANVLVEETSEGARGQAYFLCIRLSEDGKFRLRNSGRYEDEFAREDGSWKIARRTVVAELPVDLVDAPFAFGAVG
jgi:3-phenylpropionate/cinnamic acid dioxygenase small subunit